MKIKVSLSAAAAVFALAACGSSASSGGHGSTSSTPTVPVTRTSATVTSPPSTSVAPPTSDTTTVSSAPTTVSSAPTTSDAPGPTDSSSGYTPPAVNQTLHLGDFFMPDSSWSDQVVQVADKSGVQAVRGDLAYCNRSSQLELRLFDKYQHFSFSVGQDDTSPSSDQSMTITLIADGKQIDAHSIKSNKIQNFANENVAGVNDVKIVFSLDQTDSCSEQTQEVFPDLFDATLS